MKRTYESMMICSPDLAEKDNEEIQQKITSKVESLQGNILSCKIWAKDKNFYYPLRSRGAEKKKYNKGCYWLVEFVLDTEKLPDFKELIRLEERILRNIIIKKEEVKV